MNKKKCLLLALLILPFSSCKNTPITYIKTEAEFANALISGTKTIYVDNIALDDNKVYDLNYDVSIIGKEDLSTLSNAHFNIIGIRDQNRQTSINFKNIVFDGCIDKSKYVFDEGKTFEETFGGSRGDKQCILANTSSGYFALSLDRCEFARYASSDSPCIAVYPDNNFKDGNKSVTLKNCKSYENICNETTFRLANNYNFSVTIEDSEFYNNTAYTTAGFSVSSAKNLKINNVNVHDNIYFHFKQKADPGQFGGAIYLASCNGTLSNSKIINNENEYGGGLGLANQTTGENNLLIKDCLIANNKSKYGGAVYTKSYQGSSIDLINCNFINNIASEAGSIAYTTTFAPWTKIVGGTVNYLFCKMGANSAPDNKTFSFYELAKPEFAGLINVRGSFVIDTVNYDNKDEYYNYINNQDDALKDGVINQSMIDNPLTLSPIGGSKADKAVPSGVFKSWSSHLNEYRDGKIGSVAVGANITLIIVLSICIPVGIILLVILTILFLLKRKKKQTINNVLTEESATDNRLELYSLLSDREKQVAKLTIECKKRKQIADELFFSEDTIKKDLSNIYKTLKINGKNELIAKYKDVITK